MTGSPDVAYCSQNDNRSPFMQNITLKKLSSKIEGDIEPSGHWIGMMRVRKDGRRWIETAINELKTSSNFKELTIPDLLNHIIENGNTVNVHYINGHWLDVNSINDIDAAGDFTRNNPIGRNILFGIREHAMGAIVNGFGYDGLFRASCATFAVFSDYMRPAIRLAALAKLPVFYIWTHDSVGVGEDGPTHQAVEQMNSLRLIPKMSLWRPADLTETAVSWNMMLHKQDCPSSIVLSRQSLPQIYRTEQQKKNITSIVS